MRAFLIPRVFPPDAGQYPSVIKLYYFKANDDSAIAEEKFKLSDFFQASYATGSGLKLTATTGAVNSLFCTGCSATLSVANKDGETELAATAAALTSGTKATNQNTYVVSLDTGGTNADTNFSVGDKLTFKGRLSDGYEFEITLEAGVDFLIGSSAADTYKNIMDALTGSTDKVKVTKDDDTREVTMDQIFGTGTDKEFQLSANASGVTMKSTLLGATYAADITDVSIDPADSGKLTFGGNNGVQKSAASTTISFGDVQEGEPSPWTARRTRSSPTWPTPTGATPSSKLTISPTARRLPKPLPSSSMPISEPTAPPTKPRPEAAV